MTMLLSLPYFIPVCSSVISLKDSAIRFYLSIRKEIKAAMKGYCICIVYGNSMIDFRYND